MEYYGKILCISYKDLTYDDRPVIREDGKADYSKSRALRGHHPSMLSIEVIGEFYKFAHNFLNLFIVVFLLNRSMIISAKETFNSCFLSAIMILLRFNPS